MTIIVMSTQVVATSFTSLGRRFIASSSLLARSRIQQFIEGSSPTLTPHGNVLATSSDAVAKKRFFIRSFASQPGITNPPNTTSVTVDKWSSPPPHIQPDDDTHDHDHEHHDHHHDHEHDETSKEEKAAGDLEEEEQEEMFVDPHESFEHEKREWGGPRRGGRLPEPTRYGDWERNGRCSDF